MRKLYAVIMVLFLLHPLLIAENEALQAYLNGDFSKTVKILNKKYKAGEAGIQERIILARSYIHLEKNKDAWKVLESVLDTDSENPEANSLYGALIFKEEKYEEAIPYLKKAVKLSGDIASLSYLGQSYYYTGDISEAVNNLKDAQKKDVRNPVNGYLLGLIYLDRGYGMKAEQFLLHSKHAGRNDMEIMKALGRSYMLQRKYTGPIRKVHLTEAGKPGDLSEEGVILGPVADEKNAYYQSSEYSSIYYGSLILAENAKDVDALYMVCEGWLTFGNISKASEMSKAIISLDKDRKRSASLSARVLLAQHNPEEIIRFLEKAEKKQYLSADEIADYYFSVGLFLQAEGKSEQAVKALKKAESLIPASEKVIRSLAEIYRSSGQTEEAILYFGRFMELFPDAKDYQKIQNLLISLKDKEVKK